MGSRGPQKASTDLKLVRGDRPSRVNPAPPTPSDTGCPPAPDWLSPFAREAWDLLAEDLHSAGLLTTWDVDRLAACLEWTVIEQKAFQEIEDRGLTPKSSSNRTAKNAALQIARDATDKATSLGALFGLNPRARQDLKQGRPSEAEATRLLS